MATAITVALELDGVTANSRSSYEIVGEPLVVKPTRRRSPAERH